MIIRTIPNWLRVCIAGLIVPNLPMWGARQIITTPSRAGLLNVDYVIATVLCTFGFWRIGACIVAAALTCDALRTFDRIFHFTQQDFFYVVRFVGHIASIRVITGTLSLVAIGAVVIWLWSRLVHPLASAADRKFAVLCLASVMALKAVDVAHGLNPYLHLRESGTGRRLVAESIVGFGLTLADMFRSPVPNTPVESAVAPLRKGDLSKSIQGPRTNDPNVVLILVESMGYAQDAERKYLNVLESSALAERYSWDIGKVPFSGSTVSGEYRELCGLKSGARIGTSELSHSAECLPALYNARGYDTEGIHGYDGRMFARESWYPALGFQQTTFLEHLRNMPDMHTCGGAFTGICDTDIARYVSSELKKPGKRKFIYWVTLNTHLPIERTADREQRCSGTKEKDVCALELLLRDVLNSIAQIATDPDIPPTEFIVVGDHAPPFAVLSSTNEFDSRYVPFVRLVPKAYQAGNELPNSPNQK